ncbi:hypothetical protein CL646_05155 [bacterium]|nr:hypothetical protein [bacterium]
MSTLLIAGSTGLVGSNILSQLSDSNQNVIALARGPITKLPLKAKELIIDFDSLLSIDSLPRCDHLFICLGTTIKIAKSKENFKKVDLSYSLAVAQKAFESGAKKLTLISSVGANSNSKNFYLRVKGELEDAILELGFDSVNIFRPSFLIGTGGRHRAFSEKIFMRLAKVIDIFCIGSARKYRSINAEILAKKMVSTLNADPGIHYYYFDDFIN